MELNPLYTLYVQLKDKVDNISGNTNLSNGSLDLTDIIVRLKALESKPSYENEIANLKNTIQNLENANSELREKVNYLNKVDNLEARIYNIETEPKINQEVINERLNNLENNNYQERITNIVNRVNNLEQFINSITDLTYRIGELEKRPDLTERINGLELSIASLKA
jgi:phage shock protein A